LAALSPRMAWRLLLMLTRRRSRRAPHFRLGYGATASPSTERNLDQWNAGWGSDDHRYDHNEEPRLGAPGAADCRLCGRWADIEPRLYSDLGKALFAVVEDTCRHDTIYGCCSEPNNFLRYGIRGTHSCFGNFVEALAQFGLDRSYIVSNVNVFMSVPVAADSAAVNVYGHSAAANYVDLRGERDVLAVLSNCPQTHNPCNAYN
jgi:hypothetical protein